MTPERIKELEQKYGPRPGAQSPVNNSATDSFSNTDYDPVQEIAKARARAERSKMLTQTNEEPGLWDKTKSFAGNAAKQIGGGITKLASAGTSGIIDTVSAAEKGLGFVASAGGLAPNFISENLSKGAEDLKKMGENYSGFVENAGKALGADVEGIGGKVGQVVGKGAAMIPGTVLASGVAKAIPEIPVTLAKYPVVTNVIRNLPKFLTRSVGETASATAAIKGEAPSVGELGAGVAIDSVLHGTGEILKNIYPEIFRIGINPVAGTPEKVEKIAEKATGKYVGTVKQIYNETKRVIKQEAPKVEALVKDIKEKWSPLKFADKVINKAAELEGKYRKSDADAALAFGHEFLQQHKSPLSATDLLKIKQNLANTLESLFESGKIADPNIAGRKQGILSIWGAVDDILNKIPGVKEANDAMNVAYALKTPLVKALKKSPKLNFFDVIKSIPGSTLGATAAAPIVKGASKLAKSTIGRQAVKSTAIDSETQK